MPFRFIMYFRTKMKFFTTTYHPTKTTFSATFTFSEKEKDAETGYSVTSLRSVPSSSLSQCQMDFYQ